MAALWHGHGVGRRVRPPHRLGTIPASVDNSGMGSARSAIQTYAVVSRTISRDLPRSRAISRDLERYRFETAYVWIAGRAGFTPELSTLAGIVPRRCGGRTRCVGARLLRPENYYSSTLSRVRPSGSSGRAEDQDNPRRLGLYHRAEISKPCYWKSCEHIFRDVPRSPAISLRTSKPTVRAPRRWIGLVPCGSNSKLRLSIRSTCSHTRV